MTKLYVALTLSLLVACGAESPEQAKSELSKMDVKLSNDGFRNAAVEDDREQVSLFLIAGFDPDITIKDYQQGTIPLLFPLISHGDIKNIKLMIQNGVNVNQPSSFSVTPLTLAVTSGNVAIVEILLEAGASSSQGIIEKNLREHRKRIASGKHTNLTIKKIKSIEALLRKFE